MGSERQTNLGNLRVFCSDVDVSKKNAQDVHASIHSFCINLWLRIGGDWTAHDLGTSHSNQVRSLQKKTTVQVTWPFSIKNLLEVEKTCYQSWASVVFFCALPGFERFITNNCFQRWSLGPTMTDHGVLMVSSLAGGFKLFEK